MEPINVNIWSKLINGLYEDYQFVPFIKMIQICPRIMLNCIFEFPLEDILLLGGVVTNDNYFFDNLTRTDNSQGEKALLYAYDTNNVELLPKLAQISYITGISTVLCKAYHATPRNDYVFKLITDAIDLYGFEDEFKYVDTRERVIYDLFTCEEYDLLEEVLSHSVNLPSSLIFLFEEAVLNNDERMEQIFIHYIDQSHAIEIAASNGDLDIIRKITDTDIFKEIHPPVYQGMIQAFTYEYYEIVDYLFSYINDIGLGEVYKILIGNLNEQTNLFIFFQKCVQRNVMVTFMRR